MELCNSKLLKLLEYDREHDTDYMTVLNEFMENSMNVTQTAEVLFIHRNTLIYRIEKIKSIMGTTLEDSWENFTLRLSMWILLFLREYDPKWRKEMEKAYWAKRD